MQAHLLISSVTKSTKGTETPITQIKEAFDLLSSSRLLDRALAHMDSSFQLNGLDDNGRNPFLSSCIALFSRHQEGQGFANQYFPSLKIVKFLPKINIETKFLP